MCADDRTLRNKRSIRMITRSNLHRLYVRSSPRKRGPRATRGFSRFWMPAFAGMSGEVFNQSNLLRLASASAAALCLAAPALAQNTIKIGELNSYKAQPAFLEPYKKGWELAVEEVNASGGVLGKKLQVVSRDDNGNPARDGCADRGSAGADGTDDGDHGGERDELAEPGAVQRD